MEAYLESRHFENNDRVVNMTALSTVIDLRSRSEFRGFDLPEVRFGYKLEAAWVSISKKKPTVGSAVFERYGMRRYGNFAVRLTEGG